MVRHSVNLGETSLSVLEHGAGKPLLFVHGAVTTSELFRDTLEYYGSRYRTLAVDLRGYGDSSNPGHGYSIEQFAVDLKRLIDIMDLEPSVVTGVSLGGWVVQRLALDHPNQVAGLVLASTSDGSEGDTLNLDTAPERIRRKGWRVVSEDLITGAFPPGTDKSVIESLLSRVDTWDEEVLSGALGSAAKFDTSEELPSLSVPTLILVGSEDHQLPPPLSQRMHENIPGSRFHVFDGAGHFMMVEAPLEFRRVFDEFLTEIGFE